MSIVMEHCDLESLSEISFKDGHSLSTKLIHLEQHSGVFHHAVHVILKHVN